MCEVAIRDLRDWLAEVEKLGKERILYLVEYLGTHHLEDSISIQTVAFTHEELALLAGINRVTATRAIDNLKQSGVLTTSRGKLRVLKLIGVLSP